MLPCRRAMYALDPFARSRTCANLDPRSMYRSSRPLRRTAVPSCERRQQPLVFTRAELSDNRSINVEALMQGITADDVLIDVESGVLHVRVALAHPHTGRRGRTIMEKKIAIPREITAGDVIADISERRSGTYLVIKADSPLSSRGRGCGGQSECAAEQERSVSSCDGQSPSSSDDADIYERHQDEGIWDGCDGREEHMATPWEDDSGWPGFNIRSQACRHQPARRSRRRASRNGRAGQVESQSSMKTEQKKQKKTEGKGRKSRTERVGKDVEKHSAKLDSELERRWQTEAPAAFVEQEAILRAKLARVTSPVAALTGMSSHADAVLEECACDESHVVSGITTDDTDVELLDEIMAN